MLLKRLLRCGGPLLAWMLAAPAQPAAAGVQPSAAALAVVPKLRATKMGVDRAGNLWAWDARTGGVQVVSPAGEVVAAFSAAGPSAVDVDATWGVVGLQDRSLQWVPGDGRPAVDIPLADTASDVCWIGPETVALTPQTNEHRIEIWDLAQRSRVATMGRETPLRPAPGATRLRSVLLRYDFERKLLHSLESFTGDHQVFTRDGKPAWSARVENPGRQQVEAWLRQVDESAKAQRDTQTPVILSLLPALAPSGDAWVVQHHDRASGAVVLARLSPRGVQTAELRDEPCASTRLMIWGDRLILHSDPAAPREVCSTPRVEFAPSPARGRWMEATPLTPGGAARLLDVKEAASSLDLPELPPGPVMLCFGGEDLATRCERHVLDEQATVSLPPPPEGLGVKGRILIGRSPAAGARIAVVPDGLNARVRFTVPLFRRDGKLVREVAAGRDGRFSVPLLAPGDYRLDILRPGGRIEQSEPFSVPEARAARAKAPRAPPVLDLGDLVLEPGLQLEVSVVDSAGQPVPEAAVGLMQERGQELPIFFEARADAGGKAVLSGIDASLPTALSCQARGRVRTEQRLDPLPGAATCVLRLYSVLEGVVVDEGGEAIARATVSLRAAGRAVRTDPEGKFAVGELREGEYTLTVAAPGFRALERTFALAAEERRVLPLLRLPPARPLSGTVVDGTSDEPIAGATLTVVEPPGAGGATTDEEGGFRLEADAEAAIRIETRAAGYPPVTTEVDPARRERGEPLQIALFPGGRIHVAVWDEQADAPCAGCSVSVMLPGGTSQGLVTGAGGEALSPPVTPGTYHVMLVKTQSLGSVVHVQGGHDLRFAEVVSGRTTEVRFGERRSRVEVVLWPPPPAGWSVRASGALGTEIVAPGPGGTFVVRKRTGDPVVLSLVGPAGTQVRLAVLAADLEEPVVQLALPQTSVHGVLVQGEEPLPHQPLQLLAAAGAVAASSGTDAGGAFHVPYLPPGLYQVVLGDRVLRSFELRGGEALDLGAVAAPAAAPSR